MSDARFLVGDVREVLATLPDQSVDLVMTSPPFLALRSYLPADHPDKAKEIGSEATPADFLDTLLALTEELGRVLTPHGSICVELGDTYAGSGGAGGDYNPGGLRDGQAAFQGSARAGRLASYNDQRGNPDGMRDATFSGANTRTGGGRGWPLDKSLTLIPSLYAASLAYGRNLLRPDHTFEPWRVRNLVAWVRPNPPVGALGDKVRPATSYLTWATRARDRWFDLDAVRTAPSASTQAKLNAPNSVVRTTARGGELDNATEPGSIAYGINPAGAPPLDWWWIPPGGYQGAHYAVYPAELCRIPIEASCPRRVCVTCGKPSRRETKVQGHIGAPEPTAGRNLRQGGPMTRDVDVERTTTGWSSCGCPGTDGIKLDGYHTGTGWRPGVVLDPFAGSGTTLLAATGLSRDAIGIDLDERNADLARERLGMFLEVEHPEVAA